MTEQTIIQSLRDYFLSCPLMGQNKINIDYLPDAGVEYSIDTTPASQILKEYINGDSLRQYLFVIRSVNDYSSDVLTNIDNSGFFERLSQWLEEQSKGGAFPLLPPGKTPRSIEAQSTGYLFTASPNAGKYQIQCRLMYEQKG